MSYCVVCNKIADSARTTWHKEPLCVQCCDAYYRGWTDQKFDSKPVTAVSEEKCQCTENHACCLEHAGKRGFLNSDPKTWKAAPKEEQKGCCVIRVGDHSPSVEVQGGSAFGYQPPDSSQERDCYTKGDTELKADLAHLYIHTVLAKHESEEKEFRKELFKTLDCILTDTIKPKTVLPAWKRIIESLRSKYL